MFAVRSSWLAPTPPQPHGQRLMPAPPMIPIREDTHKFVRARTLLHNSGEVGRISHWRNPTFHYV